MYGRDRCEVEGVIWHDAMGLVWYEVEGMTSQDGLGWVDPCHWHRSCHVQFNSKSPDLCSQTGGGTLSRVSSCS